MVGIVEGVLIAGALGLDVYAYAKMKEAENAAQETLKNRERESFKSKMSDASTTVHVTAQPAGDSPVQPTPAAIETNDENPVETTWKPVTYEGFSAPEQDDDVADELRAMRGDMKSEYQKIHERLDTIDERLGEQDDKVSIMETKFSHIDGEVEKIRRDSMESGMPDEKIELLLTQKLSNHSERLNKKVKDQEKLLHELRAKLDSHVISAPETILIKKDLREEFTPVLQEPVKKLQEHEKEASIRHKELSKRITEVKDTALQENKTRVSKVEFQRSINALKTEAKPKKVVAAKVAAIKEKKIAAKTTTTKVSIKKSAKKAPKASVNKSAKKTVKASKNKAVKKEKADKGAVTVTTSVPKGVDVSTEVVSG